MAMFGGFARDTLHPSKIMLFAALVAGGFAGGTSPTLAQCVVTATDATCINSGTIPGNLDAFLNAPGTANLTNSGSVGGFAEASVNGPGTATFTNSGSIGTFANANVNGPGTATLTNSGSIGDFAAANVNGAGTATFTNSGKVGDFVDINVNGPGTATLTNSGSVGGFAATNVNGAGTATITNSGSVGGFASVNVNGPGTGTLTNSGSVGDFASVNVNGAGAATLTNSGFIAGFAGATLTGAGTASVTNFGTIAGGANVFAPAGTAALTNYAGSRIIGSISLIGSTKALNFVGGNFLYTLNSLAGVTINTNGAPFAVNGNSVAVLDPTALALEDRAVMNFTAGVSSMLQDRFRGMPVAGGPGGGAIGFAPEAAGRIDAAHDAFSGLPSVSMAYSSTEARKSNANAMYAKAPALSVPVYDTVVWASGFGGERRQWENGPIQRATDTAYGGAIGIDRQFTPDLRLGVFAGGGNSRLRMNFDLQRVDSDYVFGGGYGRWDKRNYYVDFALFGGGISSSSTRQISNNNVATGLEIATASYRGWFISPDVTYGYRIFMSDYVITPKARVRYVGGSLDGYSETGSAQGLSMGKRDLSDIEERLGVEFSSVRPVTFGGTLKSSVDVSGVGLQRLGDNNVNAVLLAQNIAFTTPGKSQAYGGVVNVGFDWRPKSSVSLYASVEATAMNDKSFSAAGKGGIRVGF
jgi:outer membrane autotransporter protein